jgi:hypothetical protein
MKLKTLSNAMDLLLKITKYYAGGNQQAIMK